MQALAVGALIERRAFLKSAGAAFVAGLTPTAVLALEKSDAVLASAYRSANGKFGVAVLNERGDILFRHALPARGHDVIWRPDGSTFLVFARRPGTFAVALNLRDANHSATLTSPANRHFYGHGCFSADGKLLFATENDFENAQGKIGIYDARNGYQRIGEFDTFGVGPHDVELLQDGKTLLIANGGIETHPDFTRTKLNLATMEPNLSFINIEDGSLLGQFVLPKTLQKLSIRHLSSSGGDTTWFACQNEGELSDVKPLVGKVSLSSGKLELLEMPNSVWAGLRGYVGSIACRSDTGHIAITSPRGGVAYIIDPTAMKIVESIRKPDICGAAALDDRFTLSSGKGFLTGHQHKLHWDNHLSAAYS